MATFDFEFSPWQRNKSLSPNNKTLAVSDKKEAAILLLDTEKGTCHDKIHVTSDSPAGMKVDDITFCYSPDGETIALSIDSPYESSCAQTKGIDIRLWNIASAKFTTTLRGHQRRITSLIFSPDGKILASSSSDDTIRLWSTETGACLKVLSTNEYSRYYKTVFSPDGKTLVTIGRSTQLWDVDTGQLLRTLYTFGEKWAAVTPDGYYAGSRNCEELLLFRNKRTGHIEPPQNHRAKLYNPEKVKLPKK